MNEKEFFKKADKETKALALLMSNPRNFASLCSTLDEPFVPIRANDLTIIKPPLSFQKYISELDLGIPEQAVIQEWKFDRYRLHLMVVSTALDDPLLAFHIWYYFVKYLNMQCDAGAVKLIPLIPAVFYTGETWECVTDFKDMIEPGPEGFCKTDLRPSLPFTVNGPYMTDEEKIFDMPSNDLRFFMGMVRYQKDKAQMETFIRVHMSHCLISRQALWVTGVIIGNRKLERCYAPGKNDTEKTIEAETVLPLLLEN